MEQQRNLATFFYELARREPWSFFIISTSLFFLSVSQGHAATYVDASATSGDNDGSSWINAYTDLQVGINLTASGNEIWVASGTYKPTSAPNIPSGATPRQVHFTMKNGVSIYGGFAGTENLLTERNVVTNPTLLSCDIGTAGTSGDNCYHVFYHPDYMAVNLTTSALLDGFTITDGNGDGPGAYDDYGGGMFNDENSPTVTNCIFSNNIAQKGGAIYNMSSSPTVSLCDFTSNSSGNGGAIYNQEGVPNIESSTFLSNAATSGGWGGAIFNSSTNAVITACTFDSNTAGYAAGIVNSYSNPTITNCTFDSNNATFPEGEALLNYAGSPDIINCTFSGHDGKTIANMEIGGNSSHPIITNSIFWNTSASDEIENSSSSTSTVTYSVVRGGFTGDGNTSDDPELDGSGLQDNGGPVKTVAIGATGSAFDAGTTTDAPATDARGKTRDSSPDIGAYEIITYTVFPSVTGGNGTIAPDTDQTVADSGTTQFELTPVDSSYGVVEPVGGTCGGSLADTTYTTNEIYADCTVVASFCLLQTWYKDMDEDDYSDGTTLSACDQPAGYQLAGSLTATSGDCNDNDATINPGATEIAGDGVDQNCDGTEVCYKDADDDGYRPDSTSTVTSTDVDCTDSGEAVAGDPTGDCDDGNAAINPGATEIAGDGIDQNCDTTEVCYVDADDDSYRPDSTSTTTSTDLDCTDSGEAVAGDPTGDCDDGNFAINPGATEIAGDGIDQDCDTTEVCYVDADDDSYRPDSTSTTTSTDLDCTDSGEAVAGDPTGDCDDGNAAINPGATEIINDGIDQNCDSQELCYMDADDDNYRLDTTVISANLVCTDSGEGETSDPSGDCNDNNFAINPGATEIVGDEVDQNCDNQELCYMDADDDNYRLETTVVSIDTDCIDSGEAVTGDPTGDCNDDDANEYPGQTWYKDQDGDGYSDGTTIISCERPADYYVASELVATSGDPDDTNPNMFRKFSWNLYMPAIMVNRQKK